MFIRLLGFFLMCEMMWNVLYLWRYSEAHVYCNWFVTCAIHMLIKSGCFCFLGVISLMKSVQFPDFWEIRTQSTRDSETLLLEAPPYFLPMLILFFCEVGKTLMEAVETPRLLAPHRNWQVCHRTSNRKSRWIAGSTIVDAAWPT